MLIIQIPILVFLGGFIAILAVLYVFLRVMAWHYQIKGIKASSPKITIQQPTPGRSLVKHDGLWQLAERGGNDE